MIDADLIRVLCTIKILIRRYKNPTYILQKESLKKKICQLYCISKILLKKRKYRSQWVRYIFTCERRFLQGASDNLIEELKMFDREKYINYLRVAPEIFEELLEVLNPFIGKKKVIREPISSKTRLQIFLRYLATGNSMTSLSYEFRVGISTVDMIVREVSEAIWLALADKVFLHPSSEEWKSIAQGFEERWNIPNCIGAIDGRHMVIQAPAHMGSLYYNYKNDHSIVFLAICDANCKYIMCDIGAPGRMADGGVFRESVMGKRFFDNNMDLPKPTQITPEGPRVPYFLIGDEGFPLEKFMMRPYARRSKLNIRQQVFNYRLCRARRIVECSFGLLVQKFRIFRRPIIAKVENIIKIVQAAVCLHNFILDRQPLNNKDYKHLLEMQEKSITDSFYPDELVQEEGSVNNEKAESIRNNLARYFMSDGAVPWQWEKVRNADY